MTVWSSEIHSWHRGKVEEGALVVEQRGGTADATRRRRRRDDRVLAVEPEDRDAVVVGRFALAALRDRGAQRAVGRVELDVAADAERLGVTRDQRTVLFAPVPVEGVGASARGDAAGGT